MSGSGGTPAPVGDRPASISGRLVSTALRRTAATSTGSLRSSILPRVMRETSSRSSTRRTMWLTCRSIISATRSAGRVRCPDCQPQDVQRVANRRQRVAQLVSEDGEELVLAAIGVLRSASSARLRAVVSGDAPVAGLPGSGSPSRRPRTARCREIVLSAPGLASRRARSATSDALAHERHRFGANSRAAVRRSRLSLASSRDRGVVTSSTRIRSHGRARTPGAPRSSGHSRCAVRPQSCRTAG